MEYTLNSFFHKNILKNTSSVVRKLVFYFDFSLLQYTFISTSNWLSYRCSPETLSLPREEGRTLRPEDASWDDDAIPDLKTLALRVIISIWKDYPILKALPTCVDKDMLLEMLPTDLPFELTIRKIEDGIYWERAAKDRWENT